MNLTLISLVVSKEIIFKQSGQNWRPWLTCKIFLGIQCWHLLYQAITWSLSEHVVLADSLKNDKKLNLKR